MDQQAHHAPSPSPSADQSHRRPHINQQGPHSPPPGPYGTDAPSPAGLGLALDQPQHPHQQHRHSFSAVPADSAAAFDPSASFGHDPQSSAAADAATAASPSFASQSQARPTSSFLSSNLADGDFSLFPSPGSHGDQLNASLFEQSTLSPNDLSAITSPQSHHSPTPPNLLHLEANQPGFAQHSPSYNQHHFSPPGGHSRNVSLGPEAALLPNQVGDWTQPQFQGHRRSPSEYSEVSSVAPSPNIVSADAFEDLGAHSPLQRASDGNLYQEVLGIGNFSIADSSQGRHGRSLSHSPAISPRIQPQTPNMTNAAYALGPSSDGFGAYLGMQLAGESFPAMQPSCGADVPQMAPPAINIDFAPNKTSSFELTKTHMDQDSLTPPDRGRLKSRPRSVTDPFHPGGPGLFRTNNAGSLSPAVASEFSTRSESARSLSPLDRQATSSPRGRRQSTSAVPNNVIALRLADPEYQGSQDAGAMKRVQKHPAKFKCTLCPKRFTRAYNLRSHLRTHTDERPFVCTVCGKAFARQHDRKRHESLHSGEKKFVCKGDLKAGGQWGCGRRFARADALGRHFRSEAGRICIKPLLDEEVMERQRQWQEQRMQQNMAQKMAAPQPMAMDTLPGYPMDAAGHYALPAALLAQYPALAQMNWSQADAGGAMDDDMSGRSSFDSSDYDEADDGGYMSGPGTAFGEGSMNQKFGELGYGSDFGGR